MAASTAGYAIDRSALGLFIFLRYSFTVKMISNERMLADHIYKVLCGCDSYWL